MSEDINNKESASEDDVGRLHRMITKGFTLKCDKQIKKALKKKGDPDVDINSIDFAAAARWVAYNKVVSASASEERLKGVTDELAEIRDRNRGKKLKAVGDE